MHTSRLSLESGCGKIARAVQKCLGFKELYVGYSLNSLMGVI